MTIRNGAEQRAIVEWFDAVYARKGARYLRPVHAYSVFLELLRARPDDRLLDVACGPGVLLKAALDYTRRLNGVDVSSVAIRQARKRLPGVALVVGNAERLPYRDGAFDLITCLGSLERMLDRPRALAEMWRVGAGGTRYCFLVRNSNTLSWRYLAGPAAKQRAASHADADTLGNWTTLFESTGFRVERVLPDQYPLQQSKRWSSLFLAPVDRRVPLSSPAPLEHANEFVFLLEKP